MQSNRIMYDDVMMLPQHLHLCELEKSLDSPRGKAHGSNSKMN